MGGRNGERRQSWFGGIHAVAALLNTQAASIAELCFSDSRKDKRLQQLQSLATKLGVSFEECDAARLERLAGAHHQGVAVLCAPPEWRDAAYLDAQIQRAEGGEAPLWLLLDGVLDPRNFGACLRTAEACGVAAVVTPADHSSALTPAAMRASAGALARVPVVRVANLNRCMRRLRDAGVWITGLDGDAADEVYGVDYRRPSALVVGSEGRGLRRLTREACDHLVSIPMDGEMESLNLSVATALCLYEARRQRRRRA